MYFLIEIIELPRLPQRQQRRIKKSNKQSKRLAVNQSLALEKKKKNAIA